jgi:uncharacterized protein (TIGR02646 family)
VRELTERWTGPNRPSDLTWTASERADVRDAALRDTSQHCAYCDEAFIHPQTIDHFRPKGTTGFRHLAYQWTNLYACCYSCQQRGSKFDELLIAPDETGYRFSDFFQLDEEYRIVARPGVNHERASKTIELFKLDDPSRHMGRKRKAVMAQGRTASSTDQRFRYLFDPDAIATPGALD